MTSIKVKFRHPVASDTEGAIYYQIIHDRRVRQCPASIRIRPDEWNERRSTIRIPRDGSHAKRLIFLREQIRFDVERLTRIVHRLDIDKLVYSADDVIDEFVKFKSMFPLFTYMKNVIVKLRQNGKIRTAEAYVATRNSFRNFLTYFNTVTGHCSGDDIMLDCLSSEVVESYEAWLRGRGIISNTVSFYMRILRAVYNRAVESGAIEDRRPFHRVYTGIDRTVKRALTLPMVSRIKSLDLSKCEAIDYARDMFMLSFYLRGMSFVDMAYLRKNDLRHGYVTYRRRKTGQALTIAWTKEMQHILDKYPVNPTNYLLPIIRNPLTNDRNAYRSTGYRINHNLKKIAAMIGITMPLTMYCARHSWASVAKSKGVPLSVIREGMGHDSEITTQIYLAALDTSVVDKANSLIISSL